MIWYFVFFLISGFCSILHEVGQSKTAGELASQLPASAVTDMLEWGPESSSGQQFARLLKREVPVNQMIAKYPSAPAMEDNHPVNEYYFLRHHPRLFGRGTAGLAVGEDIGHR